MVEAISTSPELISTARSPSPPSLTQFSPISITRPQSSASNVTELTRDYSSRTPGPEEYRVGNEKMRFGQNSVATFEEDRNTFGLGSQRFYEEEGLDSRRNYSTREEETIRRDFDREESTAEGTSFSFPESQPLSTERADSSKNGSTASANENRKSVLVPTATPFVFAPKGPLTRRTTSPPSLATFANTSNSEETFNSRGGNLLGSEKEGANGAVTDSSGSTSQGTGWSFNSQGIVMNSHHISPTQKPLSFFPPTAPSDPAQRTTAIPRSQPFFNRTQLDELERSQPYEFDYWQTSPSVYLPSPHSPTARFAGLPSSTGFNGRERSRSSSFGGSSTSSGPAGFFPPSIQARRSIPLGSGSLGLGFGVPLVPIDKTAAAQQLKSYFGPSSVEISPSTFNFNHNLINDGNLVNNSSESVNNLPLNYLTDPDDLLYTQARQSFVLSSLSSLPSQAHSNDPQLLLSRTAMMAHFDLAMHSPNPLATLYGISIEAARNLAADPAGSGVGEQVLRLAAIRTGLNLGGFGPGMMGEGGPSSNNRKLGLYKTELCRNWEEKGSCRYGSRCQYAHGGHEIRDVSRHPKFKTEVCRTFWQSGSCGYGKRCCFIHTTIPGQDPNSSPPDSLAGILNGFSFADLPDTPPFEAFSSSPTHRRTSSTNSGSASRGFGPALVGYLENTSPTKDKFTTELNSGGLFGISFEESSSIGLGNRGGIGSRPLEVPPQYQEPTKSRLQRLSSRTFPPVTTSTSSSSAGSGINDSSIFRVDSNSSMSSFGAISNKRSSFPSSNALPFLSTSSNALPFPNTTPFDSFQPTSASFQSSSARFPLQSTSANWLGSSNSSTLDWNYPSDNNSSPPFKLERLSPESSDYL